LAGMPRSRALGQGRLLRPLLDWTRAQLADWAAAQGLAWIEDPANADPRYARTALRHQLLPYLRQHWPMLPDNLLRRPGMRAKPTSCSTSAPPRICRRWASHRLIPGWPAGRVWTCRLWAGLARPDRRICCATGC